jgi:hypothetical protein
MMTIEKAQELHSSDLWTHVIGELNFRIDLEMQTLRTAPLEKVSSIQQKISILEELKNLPQDVIDRENG